MKNTDRYFNATHARWMGKRNRRQEETENYDASWGLEQCFNCMFFVPLSGVFSDDYGACSNAESPFDKTVMFEHDGCEFHKLDPEY